MRVHLSVAFINILLIKRAFHEHKKHGSMSLPNFDDIKNRADALGLSLSKLCRDADISESTLQRWRRGDTDPLRKIRAVDDALKKHEDARNDG